MSDKSESEILLQILYVLQDILIIQAANGGVSKGVARQIAGMADARVSRIWRHIKKAVKD